MTRLVHARGFGFARGDNGIEYFIHASQVVDDWQDLKEGMRISLEPASTEKGLRGLAVQIEKE